MEVFLYEVFEKNLFINTSNCKISKNSTLGNMLNILFYSNDDIS